ncbi:DNA topoisomerase-3 [Chryseobacterium wanjuense]|uniref:DNA topoisomerase n=1 Tax=Chryseobacterium wanjuense TaxID=356305 RepID=A0A1I0QFM5_9FLAO|nr:type IA DNA topoisomerase [Chryseobacterium wanjuense]SEW25904.1 DNA topoisomerase-3 [Chryseobacterium wanjuense]
MKAVIAEKPSVAREIAFLLGASEKKDGYLEGNGYLITWALGHLVALGMPIDYGLSGFQKENLPILPDPFILTVRKLKKDKTYAPDPAALKQLKIIGQVINRADSIIVATDAGREGELIFRFIYEYLKCNKPFERLWISSLTEKAIRKGFENLKPGSEFEGLYRAAESRSRADWLVGINASQALSISAGSGSYSLGRVQTPTLALICTRYFDHKNFTVKDYFQIELDHRKDYTEFKSLSQTRWDNKKQAEDALRVIGREEKVTITAVEIKAVTEQPPLLFDLTGLQKAANKSLGLSAEETLEIAQSLYEKQYITYPRTGSNYISEDVWPEIPGLVRTLTDRESFKEALNDIPWGRFNKRIVNDLKVTDHHGLLITEKLPSDLPARENTIYDMIALRLLEAVSQPCLKELTQAHVQVLHYDFIVKGSKTIQPGWRSVQGSSSDEVTELVQELPKFQKGEELKIKNAKVLEKKTKPPVLYDEAALLTAMETAGKAIENEEERKALQNIGIGTPATRAAIIETLFARNYITREKRSLIPTEKGLQVYQLVADKKIANAAMTAEWELVLQKIENGEADASMFQKDIEQYTDSITHELLTASIHTDLQPDLTCPKCKGHRLLIRDTVVKCPGEDCRWLQYRKICGISISLSDIESLVLRGRTSLIKGMKSAAGKKFDAYIILNEKAESSFEFPQNKGRRK